MPLPVIVVLLTVMIDAMGIGLIIPVMPDLIREVTGGDTSSAAVWGGIMAVVFAVMQFLFAPAVGSLSDRYGRRPVLLISLVVLAIDYVIMALAGAMWLLLLGRVIGGITSATQSTANAYLADITEPDKRAQTFGLVGAAFGLGFVLGPMIGGVMAEFGTRAPFWAAAVLAATNAGLGWFVLAETVTDETRRPFAWRKANPFETLLSLGRLPGISRVLWVFLLYQLAFFVYPAVWPYFTAERFGWSPGMIGLSLGLFGIMMALVQGGLIRVILARLGERGSVIYGLSFACCAFTALAFLTSGTMVLILTPLTALGAVVVPALQGIMSAEVGPKRQGELQGGLTSINAVATIGSQLIMTNAFWAFTREGGPVYFPGAPFLVALMLVLTGLVVFLWPHFRRAVT